MEEIYFRWKNKWIMFELVLESETVQSFTYNIQTNSIANADPSLLANYDERNAAKVRKLAV